MLRKLLPILLMLTLLTCAHAQEPSVHIHDLTVTTLLTHSTPEVAPEFLRLCPEADADTVRCVTQMDAFRYYDLYSTQLYAQADGAAWVMHRDAVRPLTGPGSRLTSVCPASYHTAEPWTYGKALLCTVEDESGTTVRFHDLDSGETSDLLHTAGSVVLVPVRIDLLGLPYELLPDCGYLLLCSAQIAQADPNDPALTITLETIVGCVEWTGSEYAADLHDSAPISVEYGGERAEALEAFAQAYRGLYPDHNLSDPARSIVDRTYLIGNPGGGRLFEVTFNGKTFLWQDGAAHDLAGSITPVVPVNGLNEALLTDLDGDGTEEVVCIFSAGSGIGYHTAAVYNPVTRTGRALYTQRLETPDDELTLRMTDGACLLYRGESLLGMVTADRLDEVGFTLTDLLELLGF